jgi:acyl transferase domain-containing protein
MTTGTEIAIVGMSGRFPEAENVRQFWENLKAGRESTWSPDNEFSGTAQELESKGHWVKVNSMIKNADTFDAAFFGFNPREAEMTDPQHRVFLECAWEAMEDAGYRAGDCLRHVGVFGGAALSGYIFSQLREGAHMLEILPAMIANDKDYLATRISYKLNLSGPSLTVQCACSTSLAAIHLACQSLVAGECDAALAGGISVAVPRIDRYYYMPGALLSPDGRCHAFDAKARGTTFAEGVGVVMLMRLEDALRDNYPIHAVILGSAINNDAGLKAGYTAPSIEGQMQVIRQAMAVAGIEPSSVSYVEGHGTGTVIGDAVELTALTRVFRASTKKAGFCGLGSVKTNIGHLSTAAGVAGLIKAALALEHAVIPPSLNFEEPNHDFDLANSPFYVNNRLVPWTAEENRPRQAGVSSFGVGGTNAHVILREPPARQSSASNRSWHLLPISARTDSALAAAGENLRAYLKQEDAAEFADVVYTMQAGRRAFEHRRAVICSDAEHAARALESLDSEFVFTRRSKSGPPVIAFAFPGQGSQYAGMGRELYRMEPAFREHAELCLKRLPGETGAKLRKLLYEEEPSEQANAALQSTALAQPALFITEYALGRLLEAWGIRPAALIGHSVGEYAAACLAEAMSLEDAVRLIAVRGQLMQSMERGGMLSVALPAEELSLMINGKVNVAAINAPRQCVASGELEEIASLERLLAEKDVPARRLRTSHAFHSHLMEPMLESLTREAAAIRFRKPRTPFVSNLTGTFVTYEQLADPSSWAQQVRQPVLFARGIEALVERGINLILEVGPGRSLSTLARMCGVETRGVSLVETLPEAGGATQETFALTKSLAKLWLNGAAIEWGGLYRAEKRLRISLPTYPFERQRYWHELEGVQARQSDFGKMAEAEDWFYVPVWKRTSSISQAAQSEPAGPRMTLVFCDSLGIGRQIAECLRLSGTEVITVEADAAFRKVSRDHYTLNPAERNDYALLTEQLAEEGQIPGHVIHCWSLESRRNAVDDGETDFRNCQELGLFSLHRLHRALQKMKGADKLLFDVVSTGLFDVVGNERLIPANAPLLAFCKVTPQENQSVRCRVMDLAWNEHDDLSDGALAESLSRDLAANPEELATAFRNGFRWVQSFESGVAKGLGKKASRLKHAGVYLITGGLGSIGLTLAGHLAAKWGARMVLTGRTAFPEKSEWPLYLENGPDKAIKMKIRRLQEMETGGGEVWVRQANVASEAEMAAARDFVLEKYGRLDGVIFAAGSTSLHNPAFQDGGLEDECEAHFESKAYGLMVMERVLREMKLDFFVVLSSLSTVLGGLGHLPYSAANHATDVLTCRRNRLRADGWTTVDWDAWQFETSGAGQSETLAALNRFSMRPEEGAQAFELLLKMPPRTQVVISTGDLQSRLEDWIKLRAVRAEETKKQSGHAYGRPELSTPYEEPQGDLERQIANIWQSALAIDRVGRHDDFFELGGHSLIAIQMMSQMHRIFGIDFPIERAFEAVTVSKAARVLDELLTEKIESLTEEEATALLKQASALEGNLRHD